MISYSLTLSYLYKLQGLMEKDYNTYRLINSMFMIKKNTDPALYICFLFAMILLVGKYTH